MPTHHLVRWSVLLLALAAVVSPLWAARALASPAARVTLTAGQTLTVRRNNCKLTITKETPSQVRVRCKPLSNQRAAPVAPSAAITLNPGQRAIVNASGCELTVTVRRAKRVKVNCASTAAATVHVGPGGSFSYSQPLVTIHAGETVEWIWDSSNHTVTSGSGTPDNLFCSPNDASCGMPQPSNSGAHYVHTFPAAGTYKYYCAVHGASMSATVQVDP